MAHKQYNNLLKKTSSSNFDPVQFSDEMSTVEVERGERWSDLVAPTAVAVMRLVDPRATDEKGNFITATKSNPGQTRRLITTRKEKQDLLDWMKDHFPELYDGTPEDQLSDPAKMRRCT